MGVGSWPVWVGGMRRPYGHAVGEVGLRLGLLLRLSLVKRILQSHVGQDDAACHAALWGGASEALEVLVHAILSEGGLNGPSCSATYEGATVLSLQHLHLAIRWGGEKKTSRNHRLVTQTERNPLCLLMRRRRQTFATQTLLIPSYPADLLRVHSCLRGPCISCSPLPLACVGPDLQVGGVFAVPRPSWQNWRQPRTKGPWIRRVRRQRQRRRQRRRRHRHRHPHRHRHRHHCCCCQCSARSRAGKASGRMGCLCGCLSLDTGSPLPH